VRRSIAKRQQTLKQLRATASFEDRKAPALAPMPEPVFAPNERSRYVRPEFKARTLEELRTRCGADGEAAVQEARHSALAAWLMNSEGYTAAERTASFRYRQHVRAVLSTPRVQSYPWRSPLRLLSTADRRAAEATGNGLLADWEAAGSPGIVRAIEHTQQILHSARVSRLERQVALEAVMLKLNNGGPDGSNDQTTSEGQCGPQSDPR
jgi:hypothetical protein